MDELFAHLNAMEGRIREDLSEVRKDLKVTAELAARHDERISHVEVQQKWIWGAFGSATLTALGATVSHLLGYVGVGVHHGGK